MSAIDTLMQCFDRLPSKRKLDDCGDGGATAAGAFVFGDASYLASAFRLRRLNDPQNREGNPSRFVPAATELAMACSDGFPGKAFDFASPSRSCSHRSLVTGESSRSHSGASELTQFFVIINGKSINFQLNWKDTILTLHEKLQLLTGMSVMDQRLIFRGKQLQWDQTLEDCLVQKDSTMYLVSRLRSTSYPLAFKVTEDIVSTVISICKSHSSPLSIMLKSLKQKVEEYISAITTKGLDPNNNGYATVITSKDVEQEQYLSTLSGEVWVMEHLKVFLDYDTPKALVALYRSSVKGNKECADECIKCFIREVNNFSYGPMKAFFVTILLEFCRLLMPAYDNNGGDDQLYLHCRSTLGSLVRIVGVAHGPDEVDRSKYFMTVQDILPFLSEVVNRLKKDMILSVESNGSNGPTSRHVNDFSSLMHPLWTLVNNHHLSRGPISATTGKDKNRSHPYWEEIDLLCVIFSDLCGLMDRCLQKMEKHAGVKEKTAKENFQVGWSQYLAILKELSSIAKLYEGAEDHFWNMMRSRKISVQAIIVEFAKRDDDCKWLLAHKDILDFESRRHLAMLMFPKIREDYDELHEMLIDRSRLLAESFEYIAHAEPASLHAGLFMEFKNEEATGPGVLREWFLLVCQAIFNPEHALFVACPLDHRRFFPNPASKVDPLHLQYFSFSGRVIALALMHKVQIGIFLDRVFFVQLAGREICLEDIRDADPYIYSSCKQILEMDPEFIDSDALGLTFVREFEVLGSREVVELCPGGKQIIVNSENRNSYVQLLIEHCFVKSISQQVSHFTQGFDDIISSPGLRSSFFQCIEPEDLDGMLHGSGCAIPVDDWKSHTEYHGYKKSDLQISWFWEVVGNMSEEQRRVLLFYWTSVKYLPLEGFRGLASRLQIYRSWESSDRLPSSHTCFFRLCIPLYPSKEVMQDRLQVITKEHVGCSFGTW